MSKHALAFWMIVSSCGGIAVIDGDSGGSGSGGASAVQSSVTSSVTSTSAVSSTSGSGAAHNPLCTETCSLVDQCLTNAVDCAGACSEENCVSQHDALLACLLTEQNPDFLCDLPDPCIVPVQHYTNCLGSGVFTGECPMGGCACLYADQRGNTLETQCSSRGCECILNGTLIGTCKSHDLGCDPLLDCCAALFFVASPLQ